ncbi:MAG: DUF4832 domain-containing protein, partial [Victivallales bacterium]|nr:DUF4832 domain-containing protein [Victivallales bacterium]
MKQLGDDLDKINRRLGYRIQPRRISYPDTIDHDKPFSITMKIANAGVAPCYPGGYPAYTFKDSKGVIRNVFVDEKLNVRDLKVGPPQAIPVQSHTSTFKLCDYGLQMPAGDYELWFSVGDRMGTPKLNLPVDGADEQGRIFVGTVTINSPTAEQRDFAGYWIWNNVNTGVSQAVSPCTRTFELDDAPSFATLYMTCDDNATVYINGREVIRTGGWNRGKILDVTGYLTKGTNLLAVRAVNGTSFSGMIAELEMSFQDGSTQLISTDKSWRASNLEPANWEKDPAVSASWPAAVEQYRYGTGPWGSGVIFQHVK